jgi:hypothetical protein
MASFVVPIWAGWAPPDNWYGFKTAHTLSDERFWYIANRIAGGLFCAGMAIAVGAPFLFIIRAEVPFPLHWVDLIVLTFTTGVALLHSFWAIAQS